MNRPAPTRTELESSLEAYMRKQVHQVLGGRFIKMIPVIKGTPDRLVLLPGGRMYLVELKAVGGRLSAAQKLFIERAAELGTAVTVLEGRDEVDAWIRQKAGVIEPTRRGKYERKKS